MALVGPRQCGKTTLARQFVSPESLNYFDLEDPLSLARLDEPMTALRELKGLVVIDEIQTFCAPSPAKSKAIRLKLCSPMDCPSVARCYRIR